MQGIELKTNRLTEPMSLTPGPVTFSWLPAGIGSPTGWRIRITDGNAILYDSGKRTGAETRFAPDFVTESGRTYTWELTIFDGEDRAGEVSAARFGSALDRADWRAKWIDPEPGRVEVVRERSGLKTHLKKLLLHKEREDVRYPASYLRKRFPITGEQLGRECRLYATAHGVYALWINGRRLEDWLLAPGCTQYPAILNVQAYDVSGMLKEGENEILVCLCDGWYRGSVNNERDLDMFGSDLAFLAELHCGGETVLITDETWETAKDGPVGLNDMQLGEHCDANRVLDKASWGPVEVCAYPMDNLTGSDCQPIREHERFPARLLRTPNGEQVLDFGQNFAGYVELCIPAQGGEKLVLTHGETLDREGNFTQKNIIEVTKPDAYQQVFYTCKPGMNEYRPVSCFFGFRYVRVETDMVLSPEWFTGVAVYSDMKQTASFSCGNELVNRLFLNSLWSMKSNFVGIMMDCPTRERNGYTGDAQVFCPTGMYLMDCYPVYLSWLKSLERLFLPDGQLKMFAPDNKPPAGMDSGHGWCDAIVIIPWLMWKRSGDMNILEEHYEGAKRWVDFALDRAAKKTGGSGRKKLPAELQPYFADQGFCFGEWLEVENGTTVRAAVDTFKHVLFGDPEVATAYLAYSSRLLSEMAEALGRTEDAARYGSAAEKAREAYRRVYTENGTVREKKRQCRYIRPVALDLLDKREKQEAAKSLAGLIHENNDHLNTGFLSTAYLCRALSDNGQAETAYDLLLQEDSPSWLYEVKKGATTVWESWLGVDEKGNVRNSFNHYSLGAVTGWLMDSVCGIRVDGGTLTITPKPDKRLGWAKGSYDSPLGRVESSWRYEGDKLTFSMTVPVGVKAEIVLPNGERAIRGSGPWEFAV